MTRRAWFHRLVLLGTVLTLGVVVLGAYVRLSDAGLGCPDWPGCYGRMLVPDTDHDTLGAAYGRPVETGKAWREMIHRYFAGTLGLVVLALALMATANRRSPRQPIVLPWLLLGLIVFQSALGMWTVTWLLKPVVVMAHLLGGLATLGLLWWLTLRTGNYFAPARDCESDGLRVWAVLALVVLVVQIALGGWTSANYAAMACPDFPTCQGRWWPEMDFAEGFTLWRGIGIDYEGGVLDNAARVAVHVTHRIGAVITGLFLGALGVALAGWGGDRMIRAAGVTLLAVLGMQIALGIATVVGHLPLAVAAAHNAGAALLLLTLIAVNHILRTRHD